MINSLIADIRLIHQNTTDKLDTAEKLLRSLERVVDLATAQHPFLSEEPTILEYWKFINKE